MIHTHVCNYKCCSVQWLLKLRIYGMQYVFRGVDALNSYADSFLIFCYAVEIATYVCITTCRHACTYTVLLKAMLHSFTVFLEQTVLFNYG